jgi:hypothetical protein
MPTALLLCAACAVRTYCAAVLCRCAALLYQCSSVLGNSTAAVLHAAPVKCSVTKDM